MLSESTRLILALLGIGGLIAFMFLRRIYEEVFDPRMGGE
jgi:hypothetical protein